jgi:hypothetical protein
MRSTVKGMASPAIILAMRLDALLGEPGLAEDLLALGGGGRRPFLERLGGARLLAPLPVAW